MCIHQTESTETAVHIRPSSKSCYWHTWRDKIYHGTCVCHIYVQNDTKGTPWKYDVCQIYNLHLSLVLCIQHFEMSWLFRLKLMHPPLSIWDIICDIQYDTLHDTQKIGISHKYNPYFMVTSTFSNESLFHVPIKLVYFIFIQNGTPEERPPLF